MQAIGCAPHHARAHPVRNAARHPIRWPGESTAHRNRGCNRPRRIGEESERHRSDATAGASRVRVRPASGCGAARSRELSWLRDPSRLNPCVSVADQPYHIPLSSLSQAKEKQGITPPERLQKPSPSVPLRSEGGSKASPPSFGRGKTSTMLRALSPPSERRGSTRSVGGMSALTRATPLRRAPARAPRPAIDRGMNRPRTGRLRAARTSRRAPRRSACRP